MIFEKAILKMYKSALIKRYDPDGTLFYFGKEDFPGLLADDFSFMGNQGQMLNGHFYYRGEKRYDKLIVFDHGMGCGHVAYMREIELLTTRGYTVFSYDHTGTRSSEGENIVGFSQSLADLNFCIDAIRSLAEYKDADISVIGHSWGGFSTMNIPAFHPEITHVVALAGFISPKQIQSQVFSGLLSLYKKAVWRDEYSRLEKYAEADARVSLADVSTKALIIHSNDDPVVKIDMHFGELKKTFADNSRISFIELCGRGHNPNYTDDAKAYEDACISDLKAKKKRGELDTPEAKAKFRASYDWRRMTEQDALLWDRIVEFLES